MERRSLRIRERRERTFQRRNHNEEEPHTPPRGRQNQGNQGLNNDGHRNESSQVDHAENEEEVEQHIGEEPRVPPPPHPVLADVMNRQTQLLERLARRHNDGDGQGKMIAFMRLHPPTFDNAEDDPIAADDWLRNQ
jgi:hypothetical protein